MIGTSTDVITPSMVRLAMSNLWMEAASQLPEDEGWHTELSKDNTLLHVWHSDDPGNRLEISLDTQSGDLIATHTVHRTVETSRWNGATGNVTDRYRLVRRMLSTNI